MLRGQQAFGEGGTEIEEQVVGGGGLDKTGSWGWH